jgi:hypothetical protein
VKVEGISPVMLRGILAALPKAVPEFGLREAEPHAAQPRTAPPTLPGPSVEMLVALSAAEPAVDRRRRAAAGAEKGLALLDRFHRELVAGAPGRERLRELAEWIANADPPEDPALAPLWRELDVRVRVELAKYDVEI